ncbi:MAG: hypothetical protein QOG20_3350 [Pseudonocardiales bacterium]|jgi:hypothetical protein|nr:hypothetical protein [Pseudonocardiales bacterium]
MTSTQHRPGGTHIGSGPAEATAVIPPVSYPRHAAAGPAWLTAAPSAPPWPGPAPQLAAQPAGHPALPAGFGPPVVRPSGMRWGWIVIGVVGAILAVTLIGAIASAHRTMTVQGSVTLHSVNLLSPGSSCGGANAYS